MLAERYTEVELELENAIFNDCLRESIYLDIHTSALATTNHLIKAHFTKDNACSGSEGAVVDSLLLQFQAWDFVGYNDRSCQNWMLREAFRYLRQAINSIDDISRRDITNNQHVGFVKQNTTFQGLAIKILACNDLHEIQILCKQYPLITDLAQFKYNSYTSKFDRGNPLDSILERLKDLR
jgi:hypothetical protein